MLCFSLSPFWHFTILHHANIRINYWEHEGTLRCTKFTFNRFSVNLSQPQLHFLTFAEVKSLKLRQLPKLIFMLITTAWKRHWSARDLIFHLTMLKYVSFLEIMIGSNVLENESWGLLMINKLTGWEHWFLPYESRLHDFSWNMRRSNWQIL